MWDSVLTIVQNPAVSNSNSQRREIEDGSKQSGHLGENQSSESSCSRNASRCAVKYFYRLASFIDGMLFKSPRLPLFANEFLIHPRYITK